MSIVLRSFLVVFRFCSDITSKHVQSFPQAGCMIGKHLGLHVGIVVSLRKKSATVDTKNPA